MAVGSQQASKLCVLVHRGFFIEGQLWLGQLLKSRAKGSVFSHERALGCDFKCGLGRVLLYDAGSCLLHNIQIVAFYDFVPLSANLQFSLDLCLYSLLLLAINRFQDSDTGILVVPHNSWS